MYVGMYICMYICMYVCSSENAPDVCIGREDCSGTRKLQHVRLGPSGPGRSHVVDLEEVICVCMFVPCIVCLPAEGCVHMYGCM